MPFLATHTGRAGQRQPQKKCWRGTRRAWPTQGDVSFLQVRNTHRLAGGTHRTRQARIVGRRPPHPTMSQSMPTRAARTSATGRYHAKGGGTRTVVRQGGHPRVVEAGSLPPRSHRTGVPPPPVASRRPVPAPAAARRTFSLHEPRRARPGHPHHWDAPRRWTQVDAVGGPRPLRSARSSAVEAATGRSPLFIAASRTRLIDVCTVLCAAR